MLHQSVLCQHQASSSASLLPTKQQQYGDAMHALDTLDPGRAKRELRSEQGVPVEQSPPSSPWRFRSAFFIHQTDRRVIQRSAFDYNSVGPPLSLMGHLQILKGSETPTFRMTKLNFGPHGRLGYIYMIFVYIYIICIFIFYLYIHIYVRANSSRSCIYVDHRSPLLLQLKGSTPFFFSSFVRTSACCKVPTLKPPSISSRSVTKAGMPCSYGLRVRLSHKPSILPVAIRCKSKYKYNSITL